MTLHASLVSLARAVAAFSAAPPGAAGPHTPRTLPALPPQLWPAIALGMLAAVAMCCLALMVVAVGSVRRRRAVHMLARRTQAAVEAQLDQQDHLAQPILDTASMLPALTSPLAAPCDLDFTRSATVSASPDDGFQTLVEDVPGVGRIEWDARILRAFACQPDVLQRLAFHRWRMQRGMLSEFELATRARVQELTGDREDALQRAMQTSQRVAPNSQGLQARAPGQQTTRADQ